MEGGTKRVNTFTTVTNQQLAVQGGGNFAVSGGLNNQGGNITFQSLDPLALDAMERTAQAAVAASGKYVEFASEATVRGLEANAAVAQMAIGTGMTPEQILASKDGKTTPAETITTKHVVVGLAVLGGLIIIAKKML